MIHRYVNVEVIVGRGYADCTECGVYTQSMGSVERSVESECRVGTIDGPWSLQNVDSCLSTLKKYVLKANTSD